jgi:hypothetical protein
MCGRSARESGRQVESHYGVAGKASALGVESDVPISAYSKADSPAAPMYDALRQPKRVHFRFRV